MARDHELQQIKHLAITVTKGGDQFVLTLYYYHALNRLLRPQCSYYIIMMYCSTPVRAPYYCCSSYILPPCY